MTNTWLVLDANYLCHRAFHAMGDLSYGDIKTAVAYGFLRELVGLQDLHGTKLVAFCWDLGTSKRKDIDSGYKRSRSAKELGLPEDERDRRRSLRAQISHLRLRYLPAMGYRNSYGQDGYEADDLMAHFCERVRRQSQIILVSSDEDLYQLLSRRVSIWNPAKKKMITVTSFETEWGISPAQWIDVKAIAGCSTDDVDGIRGIGDKTAAKYLNGSLKKSSKAFAKIVRGTDVWQRNLELVRLPLPGLNRLKLRRDIVTKRRFNQVCRELGIRSL